jgi:hypothetical protein
MTACTLIGRVAAIASAVVALAALGRIASRLMGPRVGRWSEAFAAVNLSFAYYGRATNLDGPALMWTVLALERLLLATSLGRWRDHLTFAVFAAASIATKDQAYATYVLIVPCLLGARLFAPSLFAPGAWSVRRIAVTGGVAGLVYVAASGALFNPTGFLTRVRMLSGPASGDYRAYEQTWTGLLANLHDLARAQPEFWWPWPVVALAWAGVPLLVARRRSRATVGDERAHHPALCAVPLLAGLGSLVAFALVVGRSEHRFVLPLGFWLSFYAAAALETIRGWMVLRSPQVAASIVNLAGAALVVLGLVVSIELVVTQWRDGRRTVEARLRQLPTGTTVETYGPLVYLPRFASRATDTAASPSSSPYVVARVGPDPVGARNPLQGMDERQAAVADVARRHPDVLIITEGFALPYLAEPPSQGRVLPALWQRERADEATRRFVRGAAAGTLEGYRSCIVAAPRLPFAARRVHASTGGKTWVLVRANRPDLARICDRPRRG